MLGQTLNGNLKNRYTHTNILIYQTVMNTAVNMLTDAKTDSYPLGQYSVMFEVIFSIGHKATASQPNKMHSCL